MSIFDGFIDKPVPGHNIKQPRRTFTKSTFFQSLEQPKEDLERDIEKYQREIENKETPLSKKKDSKDSKDPSKHQQATSKKTPIRFVPKFRPSRDSDNES